MCFSNFLSPLWTNNPGNQSSTLNNCLRILDRKFYCYFGMVFSLDYWTADISHTSAFKTTDRNFFVPLSPNCRLLECYCVVFADWLELLTRKVQISFWYRLVFPIFGRTGLIKCLVILIILKVCTNLFFVINWFLRSLDTLPDVSRV